MSLFVGMAPGLVGGRRAGLVWFSDYLVSSAPAIEYDSRYGLTKSGSAVTSWAPRLGGTAADLLIPPGATGPPHTASDAIFGDLPSIGGASNTSYLQSQTPASAFLQAQPATHICIAQWGAATNVLQRLYTGASYGTEHAIYVPASAAQVVLYHGGFWTMSHSVNRALGVMSIATFDGSSTTHRFYYANGTINSWGPSGTSGSESIRGLTLLALPGGSEISGSKIVADIVVPGILDAGDIAGLDQACRDIMDWN
jgi:hypothetical protein